MSFWKFKYNKNTAFTRQSILKSLHYDEQQ